MADKKISQLTAATIPLAGTEVLPVVQGGVTKQVSVANLTAGRAISATEATLTTGNLVIGTAGKGIDFSADPSAAGMTSELLDDYEEGNWTPVITFGGGSTGLAATATGQYTKIGRQVFFICQIQFTNKGSSTGGVSIAGLPFASSTVSQVFFMQGDDLTFSGSYVMVYLPSISTILPLYTVASGSTTQLTDTSFANNTLLRISGVYSV